MGVEQPTRQLDMKRNSLYEVGEVCVATERNDRFSRLGRRFQAHPSESGSHDGTHYFGQSVNTRQSKEDISTIACAPIVRMSLCSVLIPATWLHLFGGIEVKIAGTRFPMNVLKHLGFPLSQFSIILLSIYANN